MSEQHQTPVTEEQKLYASILNKGMAAGLLGIVITFIVYASGILKPAIPMEKVQYYWGLSVGDYLSAINQTYVHSDAGLEGWTWLALLGKGDFINFLPIAWLAAVSIICYIAITPGLFKRGDKVYGILAILEVVVLVAAASGLVGGGGH
jgi:hypothetical protein